MKRTSITGKGDRPGRNDMKMLKFTISSNFSCTGPWEAVPTAWPVLSGRERGKRPALLDNAKCWGEWREMGPRFTAARCITCIAVLKSDAGIGLN